MAKQRFACPFCGEEVRARDRVCADGCRTKFARPLELDADDAPARGEAPAARGATKGACPACSEPVAPAAARCTACGARLAGAADAAAQPSGPGELEVGWPAVFVLVGTVVGFVAGAPLADSLGRSHVQVALTLAGAALGFAVSRAFAGPPPRGPGG